MIAAEKQDTFLVFGGSGWISSLVSQTLEKQGEHYFVTDIRIEDREGVARLLDTIKPTHVISAAGYRGNPNADWCETNKPATISSNIQGALNIAHCCYERGIHVTHFGCGCIYSFDEAHPMDGPGFLETDPPNFGSTRQNGSFYAHSKVISEMALAGYDNVLNLRIRFPINDDLAPKNHLTKLLGHNKIADTPNSGTVLPNLLPGALLLAKHKDTGIYNFVNPGMLSNNMIMQIFKDEVRPSLTWDNFSVADQSKLIGPRSNCQLDPAKLVNKLKGYGYEVLDVETAMKQAFSSMKKAGYQ